MADNVSSEAVENATGRPLAEWVALLDAAGGRDLSHAEIAQYISANFPLPTSWTQWTTIAYEREIGRRVVGQNCYGEFVATGSKTLAADGLDGALASWLRLVAGRDEFNGVTLVGEPRVSQSEKWRYWRADLADGTTIAVNISLKTGGKAGIGLEHKPHPDTETAAAWKVYWKQFLTGLTVRPV